MGKRRNDEEYCPLYTTVARSRKTHESLKSRLQNVVCTIVLDEQGKPLSHPEGGWLRMVGVDTTVADEVGASEEAMVRAAEAFYPPLYHAINRVRLRVSEFT